MMLRLQFPMLRASPQRTQEQISHKAVSYTHLDVYKIQVVTTAQAHTGKEQGDTNFSYKKVSTVRCIIV